MIVILSEESVRFADAFAVEGSLHSQFPAQAQQGILAPGSHCTNASRSWLCSMPNSGPSTPRLLCFAKQPFRSG